MSAGLPGVGLSGLFVLLSALLIPVFELIRTIRGRSTLARWRTVGRHWLIAAAMVGAYVGVIKGTSALIHRIGADHAKHLSRVTPLAVHGAVAALTASLIVLGALLGLLAFHAKIDGRPVAEER
jgi:hypothetical protein